MLNILVLVVCETVKIKTYSNLLVRFLNTAPYVQECLTSEIRVISISKAGICGVIMAVSD